MNQLLVYCYEFGAFRLDASERLLRRSDNGGEPVPLTPRVFDILVALVENHGRVVTRERLMERVWHDSFVEDANLSVSISMLRKALGTREHGEQYIKTVPTRGYSFVAAVKEISIVDEGAVTAPPLRRIAVLPFNHLGAESRDEYLGLGLADALITKLSNVKHVTIRPTSAIQRFAGGEINAIAAGQLLDVDAVLDGRIQREKDQVRVTVQFLRVTDDANAAPLWAETFDGQLTDIFAVEDTISRNIISKLLVDTTANERPGLTKQSKTNIDAYQSYIKGRYCWNKYTPEGFRQAVRHFSDAIRLDSSYALAYAGLAEAYAWSAIWGGERPDESFKKAKESAQSALRIDETIGEAHAAYAFAIMCRDWEWAGAESSFQRALELSPNYLTAHRWYGHLLVYRGRFDEAIVQMQRALEIDPLSLIAGSDLAMPYFFARRYDESIAQLQRVLEMDQRFAPALVPLTATYTLKGMHDEAISILERLVAIPECEEFMLWLGYTYAFAGREREARVVLERLLRLSEQRYISPYHIALTYTGLSEYDNALAYLERAREDRDPWLVWLGVDPRFDNLRSDQRFTDLLWSIGLAQ